MEIDRRITSDWIITIYAANVFHRITDESLMNSYQRVAENPKEDGNVMTDDDRAYFERYYRSALAELSALLARRTTRVGGSIVNTTDTNGYLITTFTLKMTDNHEEALEKALASHCVEFLIRRVNEMWYGQGADFGSSFYKEQVKHVIHFRKFPIERPVNPL